MATGTNYPGALDSWVNKQTDDQFTPVDVNQRTSAIEALESGPYRPTDGNSGTPAYSFLNDTDTGMYRKANNVIGIAAGGNEIVLVGSGGVNFLSSTKAFGLAAASNNGEALRFEQLGWNLIQTQNASGVASIDFTTGINSTYDKYVIALTDVMPVTDGVDLWLRFMQTGTPLTSGYYHNRATFQLNTASSSWSLNGSASDGQLVLASGNANSGGHGVDMIIFIHHPSASNRVPNANWSGLHVSSNTNGYSIQGAGVWNTQAAINGLRFMLSSGNIQTGSFSLYGVRKT